MLETGTEERSMREDQEDEPRGETELLHLLLLEDQSTVFIDIASPRAQSWRQWTSPGTAAAAGARPRRRKPPVEIQSVHEVPNPLNTDAKLKNKKHVR